MRLTVEILLKKHWQREENETGGDCLDRTARRGEEDRREGDDVDDIQPIIQVDLF